MSYILHKELLERDPPQPVNVMHQLKLIDLGNVKDASRTLHSDEENKSLTICFHISVLQDTEQLHTA